jgi:hypothetical protein
VGGGLKTKRKSWRELLGDCVLIACVCGTIGIALKFTVFFDKWVYFPLFPNIFDAAFLISSGVYLAWRAHTRAT